MTVNSSLTAKFLQIRPAFPAGSPLLYELADDEECQPPLRITCGFTIKWYQRRMNLDYGQRWHKDTDYRRQTRVEMKKVLNRTFPRLQFGGPDPDGTPDTISTLHGCAWVANLLGRPITYFTDNWPVNTGATLTDQQAESLDVPDLDRSAIFQDLLQQMDRIQERWGRIEGVLSFEGVLNNAFLIRGQDLFIDMIAEPQRAHQVLEVVTETMIKAIKAVYARQRMSGIHRDLFVTGNCVVNMISGNQYREFVMPYDQKLRSQFTHFGVHNCAWSINDYLESYAEIPRLAYLDFGLDSDLPRIKNLFPDTRRCLMYTPMALMSNTREQIRQDLIRIHDELSPCELIIGSIDDQTPDERVMDFYELAGEIWGMRPEKLPPKRTSL
jgi:hypothetical protein